MYSYITLNSEHINSSAAKKKKWIKHIHIYTARRKRRNEEDEISFE